MQASRVFPALRLAGAFIVTTLLGVLEQFEPVETETKAGALAPEGTSGILIASQKLLVWLAANPENAPAVATDDSPAQMPTLQPDDHGTLARSVGPLVPANV